MKLKHLCFKQKPNEKIERDAEGQFYLHDGTGKRKKLDRDEARKIINLHILNDKKTNSNSSMEPSASNGSAIRSFSNMESSS